MVLYAIGSSHIRQGGQRNASPLTSRLFVRFVVELADLLQPSISVFGSTIHAVLSKKFCAVVKFMLELDALLRRIFLCVCDEEISRQVICASERSIPAFSSAFYSVSSIETKNLGSFLTTKDFLGKSLVLRELRGHVES